MNDAGRSAKLATAGPDISSPVTGRQGSTELLAVRVGTDGRYGHRPWLPVPGRRDVPSLSVCCSRRAQ